MHWHVTTRNRVCVSGISDLCRGEGDLDVRIRSSLLDRICDNSTIRVTCICCCEKRNMEQGIVRKPKSSAVPSR